MLIVVLGSILGFIGGVVAFAVHDVSFLTAIGIWIASGPISALLAVVMAMVPRPRADSPLRKRIDTDTDLAETA
ncbi:MAG: hypothetical protein JJT81_06115 [Rubellimicrobium sp.]|nr:hypothetical protein [Rubellimicrobium sp.]